MDDDQEKRQVEVARILAADPHAHIVEGEGEQEAWLLTGKALEIAKAALGRRPAT